MHKTPDQLADELISRIIARLVTCKIGQGFQATSEKLLELQGIYLGKNKSVMQNVQVHIEIGTGTPAIQKLCL